MQKVLGHKKASLGAAENGFGNVIRADNNGYALLAIALHQADTVRLTALLESRGHEWRKLPLGTADWMCFRASTSADIKLWLPH